MFCSHCGNEVAEGQIYCQQCGARLVAGSDYDAPERARVATPWEDREAVGFINGLFRTLKKALMSPGLFFRTMPVTGGLSDPLLYALIVGMIGLIFLSFWNTLFHDSFQSVMMTELHGGSQLELFRRRGASFLVVLTPFFFILNLFVVSGMLHLFLLMVRGARGGFEATFRVVSYSVSPFILLAVPLCGMPIMMPWIIVLAIIGLKESHEISGGKASFAVLLPFLFSCGMLLLAVALIMGALAASFGTMMQLYR